MTNTQAPQEATSAVPSDRLWLRSELMGTQVITRDTGRRLGLVGEVVVDIDRREVVALGLRDNPLTRFLPGLPRWLPLDQIRHCLLYTSPSPRDQRGSGVPGYA